MDHHRPDDGRLLRLHADLAGRLHQGLQSAQRPGNSAMKLSIPRAIPAILAFLLLAAHCSGPVGSTRGPMPSRSGPPVPWPAVALTTAKALLAAGVLEWVRTLTVIAIGRQAAGSTLAPDGRHPRGGGGLHRGRRLLLRSGQSSSRLFRSGCLTRRPIALATR